MYFLSFYTKFPEIAEAEKALVEVREGAPAPAGLYAFLESYCDDHTCDCRKAIVNVVNVKNPDVILTTIGYGFENAEYYTGWMYGDKKMGEMLAGSYLEPGGQQSRYSHDFLELWKLMTAENKEYAARLKKHYVMWKKMSNFENSKGGSWGN